MASKMVPYFVSFAVLLSTAVAQSDPNLVNSKISCIVCNPTKDSDCLSSDPKVLSKYSQACDKPTQCQTVIYSGPAFQISNVALVRRCYDAKSKISMPVGTSFLTKYNSVTNDGATTISNKVGPGLTGKDVFLHACNGDNCNTLNPKTTDLSVYPEVVAALLQYKLNECIRNGAVGGPARLDLFLLSAIAILMGLFGVYA